MTSRPAGNKPAALIIGGGASGLAAACILSANKVPFTLLEKENKPGRKLLATGNGRCNLLNFGPPAFFGDSGFAHSVLRRCGSDEVARFFEGLGLNIFEEELGRAYPTTRQAASVLDCLLAGIDAGGCGQLLTGSRVDRLTRAGGQWVAHCWQESHQAPRVVVASGGPAAPKLGGDDGMVRVLESLGQPATPFSPSLCALTTQAGPIRGLAGQRVYARLWLYHGDSPVDAAAGELLYTQEGLSGLCAMQLARAAQEGLQAGLPVSVGVDLSPLLNTCPVHMGRLDPHQQDPDSAQAALALLRARAQALGQRRMYTGLLPRALADKVARLPIPQAAAWLTALRLRVTGTRGFDHAQVAAGGLDCAWFEPHSLRSRLLDGLYACGEALNVDGDTGGFNLLFAWASGILAARDIVQDFKSM